MDRFRRFDEAYYHRFYESKETRVTSPEEHAHLCEFVFAFAKYNKIEMKSALDKRTKELIKAYEQVSAYYQLEQEYSSHVATTTGAAQRTLKSQYRKAVQDKGYVRPEWTSLECEQAIATLEV